MSEEKKEYRGSESAGHFYASPRTVAMGYAKRAGDQVELVPNADHTKFVKATPSLANQYGLAKGVTSVLNLLAKPQLYEWSGRMCAKGAIDFYEKNGFDGYNREAFEAPFLSHCLAYRDKVKNDAADGGKLIHKQIEDETGPYYETVMEILKREYPMVETWKAELPAWHPLGFGCRTDYLGFGGGAVVCVDFKTRDFKQADADKAYRMASENRKTRGKLTPYATEPMQVAANLKGHTHESPYERGNVFGANLYLSRGDPKAAYLHRYPVEELVQSWEVFTHLLAIDQLQTGILGR